MSETAPNYLRRSGSTFCLTFFFIILLYCNFVISCATFSLIFSSINWKSSLKCSSQSPLSGLLFFDYLLWCTWLCLVQKGDDRDSDPSSWLQFFGQDFYGSLGSNIYMVYYFVLLFFVFMIKLPPSSKKIDKHIVNLEK